MKLNTDVMGTVNYVNAFITFNNAEALAEMKAKVFAANPEIVPTGDPEEFAGDFLEFIQEFIQESPEIKQGILKRLSPGKS
jgi:hypothetical protein